jgi:hypothetical protein
MGGQHSLGKLHRVSQRDLQHSGSKLDVARHGGRDGKSGERIRKKESAPDGIERPDAFEAGRFDPSRGVRKTLGPERRPTASP